MSETMARSERVPLFIDQYRDNDYNANDDTMGEPAAEPEGAKPAETVIIFDWDDTLWPTTHTQEHRREICERPGLPRRTAPFADQVF